MKKKFFFLLIATVFILSCGFYFFNRTAETYLDKAKEEFLSGDFEGTEKTLEALEKDLGLAPYLFKGYTALAKRQLKKACAFFDHEMPAELSDFCPLHEKERALALCKFLENEDALLIKEIEQLVQDEKNAPSDFFLIGLSAYVSENYEKAFDSWTHFLDLIENPAIQKDWMDGVCIHLFPIDWIRLRSALCLAQEGDLGNAQSILEQFLIQNQEQIFLAPYL